MYLKDSIWGCIFQTLGHCKLHGCLNSPIFPTLIKHSLRSLLTPKAKAIQLLLSVLLSLSSWEKLHIHFAISQTSSSYSSNHKEEAPVPQSTKHLKEEGWTYRSCGFPLVATALWGLPGLHSKGRAGASGPAAHPCMKLFRDPGERWSKQR